MPVAYVDIPTGVNEGAKQRLVRQISNTIGEAKSGTGSPLTVTGLTAGKESRHLHRRCGAGDGGVVVQACHVGGCPAGMPALRVGGPDRVAPRQGVAEHRVHSVIDGLVTCRQERH